ncbi:MAG: PLP-dependent aminotransferase family protein [Halieaceae bacterium]|jgi:2-aminoadipate transaminase|nr:PLP-dependent aminotransferase family protein [Halieaceae bacterium]
MRVASHIEAMQSSYVREILAAASAADIISLAGGLPPADRFPLPLVADDLAGLAARPDLFQYGETRGHPDLLHFLHHYYGLTNHQDLLICSGSQQGLDLIARTFINAGDTVVMEAPCYPGAIQVFSLARAHVETVPQGPLGPDTARLESLFRDNRVKMFYAVPDFHNPTGICWSGATRQIVARLCRQYGVTFIEDAPYRELRFSGASQPMVSTLCPERTLVLRSFSKIATPGIRLGSITGRCEWIKSLIGVKQGMDLHTNLPFQHIVLQLLSHPGYKNYLNALGKCFGQKYKALAAALVEYMPGACRFREVEGGMFLWLQLGADIDSQELARLALLQRVAVVPGTAFYPIATAAAPALRLNFTHPSRGLLRQAAQTLGRIVREEMKNGATAGEAAPIR